MTSERVAHERAIRKWTDLAVFAFLGALINGVVTVARGWNGPLQ